MLAGLAALGGILLALIALAFLRRQGKLGSPESPLPKPIAPATGVLGGFTTLIANAAGPVMNLYLLAIRLPKEVFLPTAAWTRSSLRPSPGSSPLPPRSVS